MKIRYILPVLFLTACASQKDIAQYKAMDCAQLRSLVEAQNMEARLDQTSIFEGRGAAEIRAESGSPWAGRNERPGTQDDEAREARDAIRAAYRAKDCR
jgi:hypothetical protein